MGTQFFTHLGQVFFALLTDSGHLGVHHGLHFGRFLGIGMQQGRFRMVVQQVIAEVIIVEPVFAGYGQQ